jgi:hypothetical protein
VAETRAGACGGDLKRLQHGGVAVMKLHRNHWSGMRCSCTIMFAVKRLQMQAARHLPRDDCRGVPAGDLANPGSHLGIVPPSSNCWLALS